MKKNYMIILILGFALAIRLIYAGSLIGMPIDYMSDDKDYDYLASSLAAGKGYVDASGNPTARRAPLTAVFFGLVYSQVCPGIVKRFNMSCYLSYRKSAFYEERGAAGRFDSGHIPFFYNFYRNAALRDAVGIFNSALRISSIKKKRETAH